MKRKLRAMPVVFACQGCERSQVAEAVARELDRRGLAEASLAGFDDAKARARFPVYVIEGCERACGAQWLAGLGVTPHRRFVLDPARNAAREIERIVREW